MGIEVATPSVATTVLRTFCCEAFDEEWFLRAELTLACDRLDAPLKVGRVRGRFRRRLPRR